MIKLNRKIRRFIKKFSKLLLKGILVITLAGGLVLTCTSRQSMASQLEPYKLSKSYITYTEQKVEKTGKILIYHSHTAESYIDGYDVVQAGEDLANKLRKKGFEVEHVTEKFDTDYNNAYFASRKMLLTKDLEKYDLIIDMHRDALANGKMLGVDNKNQDVARIMFVTTTQSPNYKNQLNIVNGVIDNIKGFGDFTRNTWEYDYGINYYNGDLSSKFVLIENGFNTNNSLEIKRANTYLAAAIEQYFNKK